MTSQRTHFGTLASIAALLLVAATYWIGLGGPLLLDDFGNLADVRAWLDGERTWQSVIFNNRSGIGGRPVSMASFVLDAALWRTDIWHFKLTNLLLHLACGLLTWRVLDRVMGRDPLLAPRSAWLAPLLALLWLLLPIHVSSVLYVVQRMAMLSALFMLFALWLFLVAREQLERGDSKGHINLWLGVPLLTGIAFFSKENGALLPLLALALEITYFRPSAGERRPRSVRAFFLLFVGAPAIAFLLQVGLRPDWLRSGYVHRDFTLIERLLTQSRVLWDYVGSILVPHGPRLGLFHDDYVKSTGLTSPWTTLAALLAWLGATTLAWRARGRAPAVLAGILLYLFGHAMESSVFPLELYFEHRNYLPSIGILLAVSGILAAGISSLRTVTPIFRKTVPVLGVCVLCVLVLTTHGRARVWSSSDTLYAQELAFNPDSPRLRSNLAGQAIRARDTEAALMHIAASEKHQPPQQAMTVTLWRFMAYCPAAKPPPPELYAEAESRANGSIPKYGMTAWETLVLQIEGGNCPGLDVDRIIRIGQRWLSANDLADTVHQTWRTKYYLARLLASSSRFEEAATLGQESWVDSGYNNGIGVFLFQVNASLGNIGRCEEILARLQKSAGKGDLKLDEAVHTFQNALMATKS